MARRVALARAIALDPPLIMYDEPFRRPRPDLSGHGGALIRQLTDALNVASILVSHDIKDAFAIADYVYLLAQGRIAAEGTPARDAGVRRSHRAPVPRRRHRRSGGVPPRQPPRLAQDLGLEP
jgi:phospholipid/cholesterol/gamma-HCH transport system ATP-binding protein